MGAGVVPFGGEPDLGARGEVAFEFDIHNRLCGIKGKLPVAEFCWRCFADEGKHVRTGDAGGSAATFADDVVHAHFHGQRGDGNDVEIGCVFRDGDRGARLTHVEAEVDFLFIGDGHRSFDDFGEFAGTGGEGVLGGIFSSDFTFGAGARIDSGLIGRCVGRV